MAKSKIDRKRKRNSRKRWKHARKGGLTTAEQMAIRGYPPEYTYKLRRSIRKRDDFRCVNCGKTEEAEIRTTTDAVLKVHHIDEDKKNCDPSNLVTLCQDCHTNLIHNDGYDNPGPPSVEWLEKTEPLRQRLREQG